MNIKSGLLVYSIIFICCTIFLNAFETKLNDKSDLFSEKLIYSLEVGKLRSAIKELDSLRITYPENNYVKYYLGTIYINVGSTKVYDILEELKKNNDLKFTELLKLQIDLLIGDPAAEQRLKEAVKSTEEIENLHLLNWLINLDNGEFESAEKSLSDIRTKTHLKYLPLKALYYYAYDRDYKSAFKYLSMLRSESGYNYEKDFRRLTFLQKERASFDIDSTISVQYEQCGAQPGMQFVTKSGKKIKMGFDTGTNGYGFSIHQQALGDSLHGDLVYEVEDGIQYNYMSEPADVKAKLVDFSSPPLNSFLVEYFEGGLTLADGVFSPLLFNAAVTINSANQTVLLRSKAALNQYVDSLEEENYTAVPYKLRKGWMFIPCQVNGRDIMMMLETGSRDVNFNSIAVKELGLNTYESTVKWRGEDYPVTKLDAEIKVGDFIYKVSGGFESDFVLGNLGYGLACAGDIGPDFIKNFVFTIDPYNKRIILEKL